MAEDRVSIQVIRQKALEFLREHSTMVVATASLKGEPHAAVTYFDVDDDFTFYFLTSDISRKFQNLGENNKVAIVVGTGPQLSTIQGGGVTLKIDYLSDTSAAETIVQRILRRAKQSNNKELPVHVFPNVKYGIFSIKPSWLTWLHLETNVHPEAYIHDYHILVP
jgi:uncharacterized protein YhbP (UPF0306 family)